MQNAETHTHTHTHTCAHAPPPTNTPTHTPTPTHPPTHHAPHASRSRATCKPVTQGATQATGLGVPLKLDRGWYVHYICQEWRRAACTTSKIRPDPIRAVVLQSPDCAIEHGPENILNTSSAEIGSRCVGRSVLTLAVRPRLLNRLLRPCHTSMSCSNFAVGVVVAGDHITNERQYAVNSFSCPSDCRMRAVAMECFMRFVQLLGLPCILPHEQCSYICVMSVGGAKPIIRLLHNMVRSRPRLPAVGAHYD